MGDNSVPFAVLPALIVLGVVAYMGYRATQAKGRGEDAGKAATEALHQVGPPALAAIAGLVVAVIIAGFAGLLFILALIDLVFRRGDGNAVFGVLLLLALSGIVLVGALGGGLWWAVTRVRHRSPG